MWSSDGKTIFFCKNTTAVMAVELKAATGEEWPTAAGAATQVVSLAKTPLVGRPAVMPGTRDVVGVPDSLDDVGTVRIDVVQNWMSEARGKLTGDAPNTQK